MRLNNLTITVQKSDLLTALQANRKLHEEETRLAREGFRIELQNELERKLADVKAGKAFSLRIDCMKPEEHLADYDDVIGMLELATESTLTIGHEQYKCWVKNEWEWRDMWLASNSGYVTTGSLAR